MRLISNDGKRSVDIGSGDIWKAVYSTVVSCVEKSTKHYTLALEFIKSGECKGSQGYEIAKQINYIRDELSKYSPDKAVYDIDTPGLEAPWKDNLSPVITSCANLFTTTDGHDLLFEIVSLLCYAQIAKTDITLK